MSTQHTPGPWECLPDEGNGYLRIRGTKGGNLFKIANVPASTPYNRKETEANARLIAAAPDMLRALQRITHPAADDDDVSFALEVIGRVTGGAQ